jgi:hypothetical protein
MGHNYSDRKIRKLRREPMTKPPESGKQPPPLSTLARDGITKIRAWCCNPTCNHSTMLPIDRLVAKMGVEATIVDLERKLWCAKCGSRRVAAQPSWPNARGQGAWVD